MQYGKYGRVKFTDFVYICVKRRKSNHFWPQTLSKFTGPYFAVLPILRCPFKLLLVLLLLLVNKCYGSVEFANCISQWL